MGRRGYLPQFRRKTLDLVATGRPVAEFAAVLGISAWLELWSVPSSARRV